MAVTNQTPELLFAYGTIGPTNHQEAEREGWLEDAVRGRLYDLGEYPVLVDWEDPGASWVQGHVRAVKTIELTHQLDPYEGVEAGLFQKVTCSTQAGLHVWVYVYPHPIPVRAVGPLTRWEGPRVANRTIPVRRR